MNVPRAAAALTTGDVANLVRQVAAIELTLSVRSFHVAGDAFYIRLPAERALGADLARYARYFRGE